MEKIMVSYVVKENGEIAIKQFEVVDGVSKGLTADMLLSVDEIVYDIVNNRLGEDEKIYFRDATEQDLIMEHLGFGMWIRNTYGLWEVLTNTLVEANPEPDSIKHPDNLSAEIMKLVSQTLRGEYKPDVKFKEEHFNDAMKIVGDI
jgi:hypothetical protein